MNNNTTFNIHKNISYECGYDAWEHHLDEIERIEEAIFSLPNHACVATFEYLDSGRWIQPTKTKNIHLHDFVDLSQLEDCKNGIDYGISNGVLSQDVYGSFYTFKTKDGKTHTELYTRHIQIKAVDPSIDLGRVVLSLVQKNASKRLFSDEVHSFDGTSSRDIEVPEIEI